MPLAPGAGGLHQRLTSSWLKLISAIEMEVSYNKDPSPPKFSRLILCRGTCISMKCKGSKAFVLDEETFQEDRINSLLNWLSPPSFLLACFLQHKMLLDALKLVLFSAPIPFSSCWLDKIKIHSQVYMKKLEAVEIPRSSCLYIFTFHFYFTIFLVFAKSCKFYFDWL